MSLRDRLAESIAALERITSVDPETIENAPDPYQDNEKYIYPGVTAHYTTAHIRNDELLRLNRRRASEPFLRQSLLSNNEKDPSYHRFIMSSPRREELDDFEPKLTFRYVCETAVSWLFIALTFLCPAIGITIIGLAADNINWGTGRGSQEANYLTAFILGPGPPNSSQYLVWMTKMLYLPQYYDTQTFSAMIAAGCICAIGGFIVGPLSIVNYRSHGQSVKLTKDKKASQRMVLLTCVVLDAAMFITATIVLIYDIPLFTTYSRFDWGTGHYGIKPKYFDPPLGEGHFEFPPDRKPQDDIKRVYRSPVHYNPLNWNCRLQGHVSSGQQHRIFELCNEGLAARNLLVILVGLELIVLISHGYSWWVERKGGPNSLGRLRLGSEEQIVPPPQEEEVSH